MRGFDGALGRYPVGIEAAHVRWHSQQGPDKLANTLALCALHHALFDLSVLGITEDQRIRVSSLYVARNEAGHGRGRARGKTPPHPRPQQPKVDIIYISWHHDRSSRVPCRTKSGPTAKEAPTEWPPGRPDANASRRSSRERAAITPGG